MKNDEQKIREVHAAWINAVNAGDLARLLTLMSDDVVFLSPGQPPFGRDEFSANFLSAHQQLQIHCRSELEEIEVFDEVAYSRCQDALSVSPRSGGESTQFKGHRVTIYRKQFNGDWLLARDAHTLTQI